MITISLQTVLRTFDATHKHTFPFLKAAWAARPSLCVSPSLTSETPCWDSQFLSDLPRRLVSSANTKGSHERLDVAQTEIAHLCRAEYTENDHRLKTESVNIPYCHRHYPPIPTLWLVVSLRPCHSEPRRLLPPQDPPALTI